MLKLKNISKYYHSNDVVALGLRKVSLDFKLGEFVAVTGESGSGKSTLLNVISGLDTYEDGEMYVGGEETSYFEVEEWESYRRQYIGFVFQNYNIIDSYSVLENVMVALQIQGFDPEKRKERAIELITKVGLETHLNHKASKLSGGQKQRAVIARALAKDCPIIVCDEPTGNLDSESADKIMRLLAEISKEKLVIVVTHNYEEVEGYATRKIRLFDGEVVEDKEVKKREDVTESVTVANYFMNVFSLLSIAIKNLLRTPRRTIFTVIVGMFIASVFMFSFGSFQQNSNDDSYYGFTNIFSNVLESRIVVNKFDGGELTPEDLQKIANIKNVNKVLEHDVVLDSTLLVYELDLWAQEEGYTYYYTNEYLMTPSSAISKLDIKKGRLPENELEVVIEQPWGDRYSIGDKIKIGTSNLTQDEATGDNELPDDAIEVTVVGITGSLGGWRNRIILTDEVMDTKDNIFRAYTGDVGSEPNITFTLGDNTNDNQEKPMYDDYYYEYSESKAKILIDNTLNDNEILINERLVEVLRDQLYQSGYQGEIEEDFYINEKYDLTSDAGYYTYTHEMTVKGLYTLSNNWSGTIVMNQATLDTFMEDGLYQAAVLVDGAFDSDKVIAEIEELGYNAIYPAGIASPFEQIQKLLSGLGFGLLLAFFTFIIWIVSYLVLRNVQKAKQKDYLIFRSIGASKKDLNKITVLELALSMAFSYVVVVVLLLINEQITTKIPHYLSYFTFSGYFMVFAIMMFLAYLLSSSFNKRIFSKSVITSLKQE